MPPSSAIYVWNVSHRVKNLFAAMKRSHPKRTNKPSGGSQNQDSREELLLKTIQSCWLKHYEIIYKYNIHKRGILHIFTPRKPLSTEAKANIQFIHMQAFP